MNSPTFMTWLHPMRMGQGLVRYRNGLGVHLTGSQRLAHLAVARTHLAVARTHLAVARTHLAVARTHPAVARMHLAVARTHPRVAPPHAHEGCTIPPRA